MCLTASRKQRNHCGGGSGCHVREENVPFLPSPAAWKLLAAAADSHTLSFLFMSNTGNQSLRPVEPVLGDGTRSVGQGAPLAHTQPHAPAAGGSLTALKLRVHTSLCHSCISVRLRVPRLTGRTGLIIAVLEI